MNVDHKSVMDIAWEYVQAWNRAEPSSIAGLFDTRADFRTPLGSVASGRVGIGFAHRLLLEGIYRGTAMALRETDVTLSSHGWAICNATWELTGAQPSQVVPLHGPFMLTMYQSHGKWVIVSGRCGPQPIDVDASRLCFPVY